MQNLLVCFSVTDGGMFMKFNVICGNPPYNKDIYVDFVQLGHSMARDYDLWITPAKWQSKNDDLSESMRNNISPYISDLVYYSNTQEVFSDVALDGGVAYYLVNKDICKCKIKNVNNSKVDSTTVESLEVFDIRLSNLLDKLRKVNSKTIFSSDLFTPQKSYFCGLETADPHLVVDASSKYRLVNQKYNIGIPKDKCKNIENIDKYKCYATHYMNSSTTYFMLKPYEVSTRGNILLYFGSKDECDSALSYYKSNLVRYLCIATGLGSVCKECFKFVPDPGSFDRIFEDKPLDGYTPDENGEYIDSDGNKHCSLYVKYKLTDEEISVIESVIRERK